MSEEKVRENRLRRMAKRQGCILKKIRRRDERALDYGKYWLINHNNCLVLGSGSYNASCTLDEIEEFLTEAS